MTKNRQSCVIILVCLIFFTPEYAGADEKKSILLSDSAVKARLEKTLKEKSNPSVTERETRYSMRIIEPAPHVDSKIVKNSFDPNIDYKLRIFDPYTKKEITDFFSPQCKFSIQELQKKGKRYETPKPEHRR